MHSSPCSAASGTIRAKHLDSAAFDIAMTNHNPVAFEGEAPVICELRAAVTGSA